MFIEGPRLVVLRMNRKCADAGYVRCLKRAKHSVFSQTGAKPFSLP